MPDPSSVLASYRNGNCSVVLYGDGTKIRIWGDIAAPEFPESIDLKITDYCDAGCKFCHEQSTKKGKHASIENIFRVVDGLPRGVEIAIGGGNPMSHPDVETILHGFRDRGLISNITVNGLHLFDSATVQRIHEFRKEKLIYGLGVSYIEPSDMFVQSVWDANTVLHVIAGVHDVWDIIQFRQRHRDIKILVLGYKQYGRGVQYHSDEVRRCIGAWRYWIPTLVSRGSGVVSFDNLALEQLQVKERVKPEVWAARYMGDDGSFTMYVDAVTDSFAPTSTSSRIARNDKSITAMFQHIQSSKQ